MQIIDGIAYYLSTMVLFNAIYTLRVFAINWKDGVPISIEHLVAFIAALTLTMMGILCTILIVKSDHALKNKNTKGLTAKVQAFDNITGESFFSKYSILALTGNSLPITGNYVGLVIFALVFCTLGIVFVRQEMYYFNPLIVLFNYTVLRTKCIVNNISHDYYFIYKTGNIEVGSEIKFINTKKKIIRLNNIM